MILQRLAQRCRALTQGRADFGSTRFNCALVTVQNAGEGIVVIVQDVMKAARALFDLTNMFAQGGNKCIATGTNGISHAACTFIENACERVLIISDERL